MIIIFAILFPIIATIIGILFLTTLMKNKIRDTVKKYQQQRKEKEPYTPTEPLGPFYARLELLKYDLGKYIDVKFPDNSSWKLMGDITNAVYNNQIIVTMCVKNKYFDINIIRLKSGKFMLEEEYKKKLKRAEEMRYKREQKQKQEKTETPVNKVEQWLKNNFDLIFKLTEEAQAQNVPSITIPKESVGNNGDDFNESLAYTMQDKGYEHIFFNEDGSITLFLPIETM